MKTRWNLGRIFGLLSLLLVAACATAKPGEAPIPSDAKVTHRAVIIGESNHDARGTISLYQGRSASVLVFEPNFQLSGPQSPTVAFGRDGYEAGAKVGNLVRNSGRQSYLVPPGIQLRRFNEVWIWHEKSGKPLGLGRLTPII